MRHSNRGRRKSGKAFDDKTKYARMFEQKSAVSFAPIGNPNIMPIMYVKSMICFWGMFCSTFELPPP